MRTPGTATSYALRGMFVILAVLGSLVPVAQAVASLATEAGSASTSQAEGGRDADASGPAPGRAEAMAFATAVNLRHRAVLDAGDRFASSLDAIISASDDALQPDGTYPGIVGIGPPCECSGFRRDHTFALEGANPGSAIVYRQIEGYFTLLTAERELVMFTLPDDVPGTPDSLRLAAEINRWTHYIYVELSPRSIRSSKDPSVIRAEATRQRAVLAGMLNGLREALAGFYDGAVRPVTAASNVTTATRSEWHWGAGIGVGATSEARFTLSPGSVDIDDIVPLAAWPDPDAQFRMAYQIASGALTVEHADRVAQYLADQTRRERIRQAVRNRIADPSLSTYFGDSPLPVRAGTDPSSPVVDMLEPGDLVELGEPHGGSIEGLAPTPVRYPVGIILPNGLGPRGFVSVERHGRTPVRAFVSGPDLLNDADTEKLLTCITGPAKYRYGCDSKASWVLGSRPDSDAIRAYVVAAHASTPAVAEWVLAQSGLLAFRDQVVRAVAARVANRPWDTYLDDTPLTVRAEPAEDAPAIATIMPGDRIEVLGSLPVLAHSGALVEVARVRVPASEASRVTEGYVIGPAVVGSLWRGRSSLLTVGRSQRPVGVALADVPVITDRAVRTFLETSEYDRARVEGILDSPELPGPVVVISSISKFTLGAANNNYATRRITLFDSRTGARLQSIDHHDGSGQVVPHFDGAGFDLVANGHGPQDASCCTTALAVTRFRWDGASFKELTTVRMQIPYK